MVSDRTRQFFVLRAGALTTVQDSGRRGLAHLAVPRAGALDPAAYELANRLVGNRPGAAALETTFDGVALRASSPCQVVVTGAIAPVTVEGRSAGWGVPIALSAGQRLDVGQALRGVRCYVAVSGGITLDAVLGSRSSDLLSGLGPPVIHSGMRLPIGEVQGPPARMDYAPYPSPPDHLELPLHLGPREEWLEDEALDLLFSSTWNVSDRSNRIGMGLDGPPLRRRVLSELPSEGLVLGSLQVSADGRPIVFLADHPTTGGYPVVGVIPEPEIWRCAQAMPGLPVRLRRGRSS
jgi:biotin-dependent carboxylase-like uncharacterized protein